MNAAPNELRLPASAGGLIDLAAAALAERAGLYALLSLAIFVAAGIVQLAWHPHGDAETVVKDAVLEYVQLFGIAYVIAVVALAIGARAAGETPATRTLLEAATARYLPVLAAVVVVQFASDDTAVLAGFGPLPDQPAILFVTAPVTWFVWGVINLAGPYAALGRRRSGMALIEAFVHAVGAAFRAQNFARLCLVAFVTIVPNVVAQVLFDVLSHRGVPGAAFWAAVPVDAIAIAPIAALQTVFALDFARRDAAAR